MTRQQFRCQLRVWCALCLLLPVGSETTENWTVSQTTLVTWIRTKLGRSGTPEPGWGSFCHQRALSELFPHKLEGALLWKPKKEFQLHMSCRSFSISLTQFLFFPRIRQETRRWATRQELPHISKRKGILLHRDSRATLSHISPKQSPHSHAQPRPVHGTL